MEKSVLKQKLFEEKPVLAQKLFEGKPVSQQNSKKSQIAVNISR